MNICFYLFLSCLIVFELVFNLIELSIKKIFFLQTISVYKRLLFGKSVLYSRISYLYCPYKIEIGPDPYKINYTQQYEECSITGENEVPREAWVFAMFFMPHCLTHFDPFS